MVGNRALLGIAGLVWLAAGVNILRIGIKAVLAVIGGGLGRTALSAAGIRFLIRCAKE